jgi:hypothetical protein
MRIPNSGVLTLTETPLAFDADHGAIAPSTRALSEAASKNLRFIIDLQGVTGDSTTRHIAQPTLVGFNV